MEKPLTALRARLSDCPTRDRAAFARRLHSLGQRGREGKPVDRALEQWVAEVDAAAARLRERRAALPVPTFDDSLPVAREAERIQTEKRAAKLNQLVEKFARQK